LSLVEVLIVISILILLSGLLYPVFIRAKAEAKITKSVSNMKQILVAALLYAEDNQPGADPVTNLPGSLLPMKNVMKLPAEVMHTGGRPHYADDSKSDVYVWCPSEDPASGWREYVVFSQGNPVILIDATQDPDKEKNLREVFVDRFGIATFYDGHAKRKRGRGSVDSYNFWK